MWDKGEKETVGRYGDVLNDYGQRLIELCHQNDLEITLMVTLDI